MHMQDDNLRADFQNRIEMLSPTNRVILAIYIKTILISKWIKRLIITAIALYIVAWILVYITPLLY